MVVILMLPSRGPGRAQVSVAMLCCCFCPRSAGFSNTVGTRRSLAAVACGEVFRSTCLLKKTQIAKLHDSHILHVASSNCLMAKRQHRRSERTFLHLSLGAAATCVSSWSCCRRLRSDFPAAAVRHIEAISGWQFPAAQLGVSPRLRFTF